MIDAVTILLYALAGGFKWLRDRINNRQYTQITLPNTPKYQNGTGKSFMGIYGDWWHRADFLHMSLLVIGTVLIEQNGITNIFLLDGAIGLAITLLTFTILWNSSLLIKKQ